MDGPSARGHAPWLAALLALFALRVIGQALVAFAGVTWLPPMDAWQSGLLPYPLLLASQLLILCLCGKVCLDFVRGSGPAVTPRPGLARWLPRVGRLYLAAMVVRYVLRMAWLHPEARWLGGTIPIFFHGVLACWLLVLGRFHGNALAASAATAGRGAGQ